MNLLGVVLLLAVVDVVAAESDLVNERVPVSAAAMESHWGVNCAATVRALGNASAQRAGQEHDALGQALAKCRYIHQPPGDGNSNACPDYAALHAAWKQADAAALTAELARSGLCHSTLE